MRRKTMALAFALVLGLFAMPSRAEAWGCYHVGYTHVGYGGVQHYGATGVHAGGAYGGGAYGGYHYGGASYHYGYARRW